MFAIAVTVVLMQQILPASQPFQGGLADAREPRVALALIDTDLLGKPFRSRPGVPVVSTQKSEKQAVVQLGTEFPLLRIGSVVASLQGGVLTRFRVRERDKDELSNDFTVALPISYARGAYSGRVRLLHRSSHLGDEFLLNSGVGRIEFTHEEIDALIARSFDHARVYAGGSKTIRSYFPDDDHGWQVGMDAWSGSGGPVRGVAGIDWQRQTITQGLSQMSAAAGGQLKGPAGFATLLIEYHSGSSTLGEFFPDRERYWGLQLVLSRSSSTGNPPGPPRIW